MTTEAKIAANRRNAQKSTGPRTPEGKARSSRNALQHGLRAETLSAPDLAIVGESPDEFTALLDALTAELAPVGPMEEVCVETVAVSIWRLRRSLRVENGEIARAYYIAPADDPAPAARASLPDTDRLNAIVRYEAHVQRQLDRALSQLAALRRARELRQSLERLDGQQTPLSPWGRGRGRGPSDRLHDPDLFNPSRGGIADPATFYARLAGTPCPAPNPRGHRVRTGPTSDPAERTHSGLDGPATGCRVPSGCGAGGGQENPAPSATDRTQATLGLPDEPDTAEQSAHETTDRTHPAAASTAAASDHPADPARPPAAEGQVAVPPPPGPRSLGPGPQRPSGAHQPTSRSGPTPSPLVAALTAAITSQLLPDRAPASSPPSPPCGEGARG